MSIHKHAHICIARDLRWVGRHLPSICLSVGLLCACCRLQQNLKQITRIAKCICPHPLHFNIVVNHSSHPWRLEEQQQQQAAAAAAAAEAGGAATKGKATKPNANKKDKPEKKTKAVVQKKADLIRAKNIEAKQQKANDVDLERAENMEHLVGERTDVEMFR